MPKMPRPIGTRFAKIREAKAIRALLSKAKSQIPLNPTNGDFDDVEYATKYIDQLKKECRRKLWVVIDVNGEIAGAMRLNGNEIFYLVVDERYRSNGLAQKLIAYAKWRWRTLWAKTKETNIATVALLRKEGFKQDFILHVAEGWLAFAWEPKPRT